MHKEDLNSGTKSAILGGVTGVFEMPNTNPSTTNLDALLDKLERAKNRSIVITHFMLVELKIIVKSYLN